jgi:organic hydroperoxide reductase OsmC/OhrA
MSGGTHSYEIALRWTGNRGEGTSHYTAYGRTHELVAKGKPVIPGSSDPVFRGEADRYNPEDLLVAALSGCHLLVYLHLCVMNDIVVEEYTDDASGTMIETEDGGHFTDVLLRPVVTISRGDAELAQALHERAHHGCFVASSVNFPVRCEPTIVTRA